MYVYVVCSRFLSSVTWLRRPAVAARLRLRCRRRRGRSRGPCTCAAGASAPTCASSPGRPRRRPLCPLGRTVPQERSRRRILYLQGQILILIQILGILWLPPPQSGRPPRGRRPSSPRQESPSPRCWIACSAGRVGKGTVNMI